MSTLTLPKAALPQPSIDPWNKPFWDACAQGRLTFQRCLRTGQAWYSPSPVSPFAPGEPWDWVESAGRGEVLSWVVFHQKYFPGFADRIPYNVAMVRLDEGPVLLSNIDAPNEEIRIGRRVRVRYEQRGAVRVPIFGWDDA